MDVFLNLAKKTAMFWEKIKNCTNPDFKRLTGVNRGTFKLMVKEVEKHERKKVIKKDNSRGRPFQLCVENQILMMLMYYREYRTQFHIGETYGLDESNVCKNIKRIERILKKSKQFDLPGKKKLSQIKQQYEVIVIDATESSIERPKKTNTGITQGKRRNIPLKHKL